MQKTIIYEQPLNERVRTLLRLEHLFGQARHCMQGESSWDSRATLTALLSILDILGRGDLKTELIKELERATNNLSRLLETPGVDHDRLKTILRALDRLSSGLRGSAGQLGQELKEDEFLGAIRQRLSIPGGTCDFDLPAYHHWLEKSPELRQGQQQRWYATMDPVRQAVELLLRLIRSSADFLAETAAAGVFQQSLATSIPFQMIRIALPHDSPYYAEISGGKHRFTARFLFPGENKSKRVEEDVSFSLGCCSL